MPGVPCMLGLLHGHLGYSVTYCLLIALAEGLRSSFAGAWAAAFAVGAERCHISFGLEPCCTPCCSRATRPVLVFPFYLSISLSGLQRPTCAPCASGGRCALAAACWSRALPALSAWML